MAESLKNHGVIQPILVRETVNGEADYEIIAGERRWLAARKAGLHDIPVVVAEADDLKSLEFAIVENVQRHDLNPLEEAQGYKRLIEEFEILFFKFEPTFLDLVSPGSTSLQDTSINTIMSTNPLFTWNADYCSNCHYGIRVCKYDPSVHSSLSDAINDNSMLPSNQSFDFYPVQNNQSFSYPSNDAFDLMPGELYVWQIN